MDISKIFSADSFSVDEFLNGNAGAAFLIPYYQRPYSWGQDNVDQMMEDIMRGVSLFSDANQNKEQIFKFLGTLILVEVKDNDLRESVTERKSRISKIYMVVDGQQRISTLAIIATQLYNRIYQLISKEFLSSSDLSIPTKEILAKISRVFSVRNDFHKEKYKPIIIRQSDDKWLEDSSLGNAYKSPLSSLISRYVSALPGTDSIKIKDVSDSYLSKAISTIRRRLDSLESNSMGLEEGYPSAWDIIRDYNKRDFWENDPKILSRIFDIEKKISEAKENFQDADSMIDSEEADLLNFVQLITFSQVMLERCGFTVIDTDGEEWAFDMFQSLNATGTPLTAIETFKPIVMADSKNVELNKSLEIFSSIDMLFEESGSPDTKNRLTNSYLIIMAIIYAGEKIGRSFSEQRSKLKKYYSSASSPQEKLAFLQTMANLANYMSHLEKMRNKNQKIKTFNHFDYKLCDVDKDLVNFCQTYLISAGHEMSNSVIAAAFGDPKDVSEEAKHHFAETVKVVTAFYTIWRAATDNKKLDDVYRNAFRNADLKKSFIEEKNVKALKEYFRQELAKRGLGDFESWYSKAATRFTSEYAGNEVIRCSLLLTYQKSICEQPPFLTIAREKLGENQLKPETWHNAALSTIEHIAPQNPTKDSNWDVLIYENGNERYDRIGNLTLLPSDANSSAGNKSWKHKYLYYAYLSSPTENEILKLDQISKECGIAIGKSVLANIKTGPYSGHLEPIKRFGESNDWKQEKLNNDWNAEIIDKRTESISKILYYTLVEWLS